MLCLTLAYEGTWILLSMYLELTILIFSVGCTAMGFSYLSTARMNRCQVAQIPCKHLFLPSFLPCSFPFSNIKVVGLILILYSFPSQYLSLLCMAKDVSRAYRVKCTLYGKMLFAELTTWQFRKTVGYILYNCQAKAMNTLWFTKN